MADSIRIDKILWAVRLYKTRSIATDALKRGKVTMGGTQVKSSRAVKVGDVISIKVPGATRSFEVLMIPRSRMGAKLVKDHIREVTPKDQQDLLEMYHLQMSMQRQKGLGRPTKKERRDIDSFFADAPAYDDDLDIYFGDEDDDDDDEALEQDND